MNSKHVIFLLSSVQLTACNVTLYGHCNNGSPPIATYPCDGEIDSTMGMSATSSSDSLMESSAEGEITSSDSLMESSTGGESSGTGTTGDLLPPCNGILCDDFSYPIGELSIPWYRTQGDGPIWVRPGLSFPGYISSEIGNAAALTFAYGNHDVSLFEGELEVASGKVFVAAMFRLSAQGEALWRQGLGLSYGSTGVYDTLEVYRSSPNAQHFSWQICAYCQDSPISSESFDFDKTYLTVSELDLDTLVSKLYVFSPGEAPWNESEDALPNPIIEYNWNKIPGFGAPAIGVTLTHQSGMPGDLQDGLPLTVDGIRAALTWSALW